MESTLEDLVGTLSSRFLRDAGDVRVSNTFEIASDLVKAMSAVEHGRQLGRMATVLDAVVAGECGVACTSALACASGALLMLAERCCDCDVQRRYEGCWMSFARHIFSAHPSYPEDIIASACYATAQLAVRTLCRDLFDTVCTSLRSGGAAEDQLTITSAVEILAQVTSLLIGRPSMETTDEPLMCGPTADGLVDGTCDRDAVTPVGRARLVTRPSGDVRASATENVTITSPPHTYMGPGISEEAASELTHSLIPCCLQALGASVRQRDSLIPPLICRRVLIPLLLHNGGHSLLRYQSHVYELLQTLAADEDQKGEVVVLMAALFDFLLRRPSLRAEEDYRFSDFLWGTIHGAFWDALTANTDAGRRANMQLRAEYLLKRLVHLTKGQEHSLTGACDSTIEGITTPVAFHQYFLWVPGQSAPLWDSFFQVFETLNEFGLHIIQPVLTKLDALVAHIVDGQQGANDTSPFWAIHPVWLEILALKMVLHPNTGVRKLAVQRIWGLPHAVVRTFSASFLFSHLLRSSVDLHLCSEVDRTPITANFLATKAFEGREVKALPHLEPLAKGLEDFYANLFTLVLHSAKSRTDALRRMLKTVREQATRFALTLLLRTMQCIAKRLLVEAANDRIPREWTTAMLLDQGVLDELGYLLREGAQENIPFWLDVRVTAVAFSALLSFAALDPPLFCDSERFWELLCACGPLGRAGGTNLAVIDACGCYGSAGSGIDPRLLNAKLISLSNELQLGDTAERSFVHAFLRPESLVSRVRYLLQSQVYNPTAAKKLLFLVGALTQTGCPRDADTVSRVAAEVCGAVVACRTRAYIAQGQLLTPFAVLVELHHTVGTSACSVYFTADALTEMSAVVLMHTRDALSQAERLIPSVDSPACFAEPAWELLHTSTWDILAAAMFSIQQMALQKSLECASKSLGSTEAVRWLVQFLHRCAIKVYSPTEAPMGSQQNTAQQVAQIVVARNATRLLQSVLCSLVFVEGAGILPTVPEGAQVRPFLSMASSEAAGCIAQLAASCTHRLTLSTGPCPLSGLSWSTLLAQHYRGIYNAMYILCHVVDPADTRETVKLVESFGMEQLEQCWTSNLPCVYDLLAWVADAASRTACDVDLVSVVHALFKHMGDVRCMQHARACALAFHALRYALRDYPELVADKLHQAVTDEGETERGIYFAAVTTSMEVMRNPGEYWSLLKEALLNIAVLHSPVRDEENEATLAATEPLMASWPAEMRLLYPPTVRMATVGRALTTSTILWCCSKDPKRAKELSLELLDWNCSHPVITHEPCMPNSRIHRARIRLWQLTCALLPTVSSSVEAARAVLEKVIENCIPINNMGSVRRFMELYAICVLQRWPSLYTVIDKALERLDLRPQVCGSYVLIASHALLRQEQFGPTEPGLFEALFPRLLQQCISNQHLLRIISHTGVFNTYNARIAKGTAFSDEVQALYDCLLRSPEHRKFREKNKDLLFYDTEYASTPRQIFCVQRKEATNILHESIPAAAFERIRFIETELCCLMGALYPLERLRVRHMCTSMGVADFVSHFQDFVLIPHTEERAEYHVDYTAECMEFLAADSQEVGPTAEGDAQNNIQRKITSWWNSEIYNELHPRALRRERQPIVIVGSLLQNPVNIAGLCRCGDIFAVEKVIIPDRQVLQHPHFVPIARSAELWIPFDDVAPKDLPTYLAAMRRDGYTIVGIEQTAHSVSMADYTFPRRSVILLGSEGHGVPAPLLHLVDVCVEIPQYGLIRSLNVHVTGAIVMYEYTKQHRMCMHDGSERQPVGEGGCSAPLTNH